MNDEMAYLVELAGIIDEICQNQTKVLTKVAGYTELPEGLRADVRERVKYLDLSRYKIRKLVDRMQAAGGTDPVGAGDDG